MFGLGLIPKKRDMIDPRDIKYSTLFKASRKADRVILDPREIKNQFDKGACAAFGTTTAIEPIFRRILSPLWPYRNAKLFFCPYGMKEEGTLGSIVMKAAIKMGMVDEYLYPYSNYRNKLEFPEVSEALLEEGKKHCIDAYVSIDTSDPEQALAEVIDNLLHKNHLTAGLVVGLVSYFNPEELPNGDVVLDMPEGRIAGHLMDLCGVDVNMTHTYKSGITRKGFARCTQSYGKEERESEFGDGTQKLYTKTGFVWVPFDYLFGQWDPVGTGDLAQYVNELLVPLKDIPFDIQKIDPGNINISPYIKNGRTLVPLRFIGEALGMEVLYTEHDRGITVSKNGLLVKLNVDSTDMQVNSNFINLDVPPEVREGRTFVPLRAVAEAFGAEVNYFGYEQKVEIKYQDIILEMWIGRNEARKIKRL